MKIQKLKREIEANLNINIDFRSDKYIVNLHTNMPIMNYNKAIDIINEAIKILNEAIKILNLKYVNTNMILNSIKINTLKSELENLIDKKANEDKI